MTQQEKQLLLKDLCARLPYSVYVTTKKYYQLMLIGIDLTPYGDVIKLYGNMDFEDATPEDIKPYLRSLLSMTEDEKEEQSKIVMQSMSCSLDNSESATTTLNDWLLSKHFDVRGLISKGLALEAPEGMYKK